MKEVNGISGFWPIIFPYLIMYLILNFFLVSLHIYISRNRILIVDGLKFDLRKNNI